MRASSSSIRLLSMALAGLALAAEPTGVWLDVPFVKQRGNGCGAACISMVMGYWSGRGGPPGEDVAKIQSALYSKAAKGIFETEMSRYFRDAGFRTFDFSGTWADLREHLSKGRPLIVCLGEQGWRGPLHYVVVTGLDWRQDLVMVNDPARRKLLKIDRATFEQDWGIAGHWTLLALPREAA
jgi:ABC-type bacteriocin/lantibiotic exporter with double-glycine peptidase domain